MESGTAWSGGGCDCLVISAGFTRLPEADRWCARYLGC